MLFRKIGFMESYTPDNKIPEPYQPQTFSRRINEVRAKVAALKAQDREDA